MQSDPTLGGADEWERTAGSRRHNAESPGIVVTFLSRRVSGDTLNLITERERLTAKSRNQALGRCEIDHERSTSVLSFSQHHWRETSRP